MIESFEHKGHTVEIHIDENPQSPREWDNLGTMVCFHNCYSLGDDNHDYKPGNFGSFDDLRQQIMKDHSPIAIVPIYMMDHSGLSISADADRFSRWDSQGWDWGQIGFAFVIREKALKEYGGKRISPKIKKQSLKALLLEIETYDMFIKGEVYGFTIDDDKGMPIESVWGYYGIEECREAAKTDCLALEV